MSNPTSNPPLPPPPTTLLRPPQRRRLLLKRRKLPVVRLGGATNKQKKGTFIVRIFRRVRLKCLKLHYKSMLKKLKGYYSQLLKDMRDASASLETFQQRILLETSFAVPVMGVSFNTFPSSTSGSSDRPRSFTYV